MRFFLKNKDLPKLKISHTLFCVIYTTLLYGICNGINFNGLLKWFYLKEGVDVLGILAFLIVGLCLCMAFFTLLAGRHTIKLLAIVFVILSATGTYFIAKYGVAINSSMIMNAMHTDPHEVHALLSIHMIPYALFLIALPIALILLTEITFKAHYFVSSLKLSVLVLGIGIVLVYAQFDSLSRATNISKKYVIYSLTPVNYIQSLGSIIQHAVAPYIAHRAQSIEVSGKVTANENLIVVLAIGETSRQKNFSLYGYQRHNTNPILSQVKDLHILNGHADVGSTLYALPEILVKKGIPLPALTSKVGVETACYVNYTLYNNCAIPGEVKVSNCGHQGVCYDEDVLPLLRQNLKSYRLGPRLVVLHLGGGSHGPNYHERYPQEFQHFQPFCREADVVNHCTMEELYNAYDNTILYVDHVVGKIIQEMEASHLPYTGIYLSDHGESLMEGGRVFHGMPPGIRLPPEQSQIPLLVKASIPITIERRAKYSQNDLFDTILDLLSIQTPIAERERSFIKKGS